MSSTKLPTEAELAILQVLWTEGPSSVRTVLQRLSAERDVGYTTVLKLMQIMTKKGLVVKDETVRPQIYRPAQSRRSVRGGLLTRLADGAFDGSAGDLALHALKSQKVGTGERAKIRALLDEMEGRA